MKTPKTAKTTENAVYRVLALQPLSIEIGESSSIENLSIQGVPCNIAIRPTHKDKAKQFEVGGSLLAIEFEGASDADLLVAAREGFELIEDFLSAITVVSGATIGSSVLLQLARLTSAAESNCEFLQFLQLPANRWHEAISRKTVATAGHLVAHWDGLEDGKRLRRAARRYRDAIGTYDDVTAFQQAYIGLEAMEPPLARMSSLTPGTEEIQGECEACHTTYTRKKTALVGVRFYILGGKTADTADAQRSADWKLLNDLRNKLMHGLADENRLDRRPHDAMLAAMHYLHDSISTLSHAAQLAGDKYRLARGPVPYVLAGSYSTNSWPELASWGEIVETSSFRWVSHDTFGLVPEVHFHNRGLRDLGLSALRLTAPLSFATMDDLKEAKIERN